MRDQNYDLIDLFKLIMSVGVVSIHIGVPGLKTIGRLAVPYFLIVSSYLFFIKYKTLDDNGKKKKYENFVKESFCYLSHGKFFICLGQLAME